MELLELRHDVHLAVRGAAMLAVVVLVVGFGGVEGGHGDELGGDRVEEDALLAEEGRESAEGRLP